METIPTSKEYLTSHVYITKDGEEDVHDTLDNVSQATNDYANMVVKNTIKNNTFQHPIPARKYMEEGGNLNTATFLFSDIEHTFVRRDGSSIYLTNSSLTEPQKVHIDTCWVLANVLLS